MAVIPPFADEGYILFYLKRIALGEKPNTPYRGWLADSMEDHFSDLLTYE